jgi:hypothetical protein
MSSNFNSGQHSRMCMSAIQTAPRLRKPESPLDAVYADYAKMVRGNQKEPWQS